MSSADTAAGIGKEKGKSAMHGNSSPATPEKGSLPPREARKVMISLEDEDLRALHEGPYAPGLQTFDEKYMPFASGFSYTSKEASVYRPTRVHVINPTAVLTDDVSYYYQLDSGKSTPAAIAANPDTQEEFVRNTRTATEGGFLNSLMKPIQ